MTGLKDDLDQALGLVLLVYETYEPPKAFSELFIRSSEDEAGSGQPEANYMAPTERQAFFSHVVNSPNLTTV